MNINGTAVKGYFDQNYPCSVDLIVDFGDGDPFEDGIKGLNVGHALYLAGLNWSGATFTVTAVQS
jgi:hypothetical protein